jgi:hypothetical protein
VVLADGEDVEPHLVRALRDPDDVVDALGLARRLARDGVPRDGADGEDAELHGCVWTASYSLHAQLYQQA